jgi:hypothetical protein
MLRKVRNDEDARSCLKAAEASRLPRAVWARRNGVDARSLNAWRVNLERARPRPRLVELVPTRPVAVRYTVRFGDFEVEVDEWFEADVLRRLLEVVASC